MIKDKKIMVLSTTDNMIWQFLLPHIKYLQDHGNTVECVCSKTGFWFDELSEKYGLKMHEIAFERSPLKIQNLKSYKQLVALQKQENFELIYCQQPVGGLMGRLIAKKFKKPCIYTAHGFAFFKGNSKIKNLVFKTVERWLAKYTDALIVINEEDYQAAKNWKAKKVFKINGIGMNEQKYDLSSFDIREFKQSLGVKLEDKIVLSVSEFIKRKNYPTMLESFAELLKIRQDVKYILCGTGVLLDEMKQYAEKLGIADNVKFLGYRKDINKIMQISDVYFHESFQEGLTMGIMEAMHFGLPAVVSNVRGNQDLIDNEKGGFVTGAKDIKAQVEALNKILSNDDLCRSMGDYNKQKVKDYYIDSVLNQLEDVYKKVEL